MTAYPPAIDPANDRPIPMCRECGRVLHGLTELIAGLCAQHNPAPTPRRRNPARRVYHDDQTERDVIT